MPRGKLHYDASFDEDGYLIETWKDSHGREYAEITNPEDVYLSDDEPTSGEYYTGEYSDPYDD